MEGDINTINMCFHTDWSAGSAGHFIVLYKHCKPRSRALMSLSSPDKPLEMTCANIVCYLFILNCGVNIDCSCKFRSNIISRHDWTIHVICIWLTISHTRSCNYDKYMLCMHIQTIWFYFSQPSANYWCQRQHTTCQHIKRLLCTTLLGLRC